MSYAIFFFGLFILLKPYYLLPSGSLGLGDLCLLCSFFSTLCNKRPIKICINYIEKDILFYIFIGCIILINGLYGILFLNPEYLKYMSYWLYAGITIYTFRLLYSDKFLSIVAIMLKTNICIQALIFILGVGRNFYEAWGGIRYMGTFNDPNQFAFYIFASLILLYFYVIYKRDRSYPLFFVLGLFLIFASKSTGIFLGIFIFLLSMLFYSLRRKVQDGSLSKQSLLLSIVLSLVFVSGLLLSGKLSWQNDFTLFSRVSGKMELIMNGGFKSLLYDRSAQGILLYPQYLLYGAGEGGLERFFDARMGNEIHCSILNILFSYGMGATFIFLLWLKVILSKIDYRACLGLAALLVESMLLINYRQPFFWMIIIWASLLKKDNVQLGNTINLTVDSCGIQVQG